MSVFQTKVGLWIACSDFLPVFTHTHTHTHLRAVTVLTTPLFPYLSPQFTAGRLLFGCCCLHCLAFTPYLTVSLTLCVCLCVCSFYEFAPVFLLLFMLLRFCCLFGAKVELCLSVCSVSIFEMRTFCEVFFGPFDRQVFVCN